MKKLLFLLVLACTGSAISAQDRHTYVTDRKFSDPVDLIGYNFCPSGLEIRDEMEREIDPGDYSFGITQSNLYVSGPSIKGVYSLNNINSTDYGFKMLLMNARDPTIQGHLKIILNPENQVEALIFKRSTSDPEMIFYQAEIAEKTEATEADYFTDLTEMEIEATDSLWGKTFYPFLKIHDDVGTQERLLPSDSVSIQFVEKVTIIDKTKEKKEKKKKKKQKEEVEVSNIELGVSDEDLAENGEEDVDEAMEDEEAGSEAMAEADEMPAMQVDDGAMPPITEADVAAAKKDIKIVKEYFVLIRSILTYEDGTTEDKLWEYPIKKVVEREDTMAGPMEERYQIEVNLLKGGDPLYLYLTGQRTVSSFEMGPKRFLMRGH